MIKRNLLEKAVEEYSKFHGVEAQVKVLKQHVNTENHLLMQFVGPFCFGCATDEYYIDFQVLLEEITGLKFKMNSVKQGENGAVVDFVYDESKQALVYFLHF